MIKELIQMNSKKLAKRLSLFLANLLVLILNACAQAGGGIVITDKMFCSPAGMLSEGGICSHLISKEMKDMNFEEFLDFLESNDGSNGKPAKGAAICTSASDYKDLKTSLETACRML